MNKFDLLNDSPLNEEPQLTLHSIVSLKPGWKGLPHHNLPTQHDPLLNNLHTFKIIHIYDKSFIQIKSIESGHCNVVHRDWIELVKEQQSKTENNTYYKKVKLKSNWNDHTIYDQSKFKNIRFISHMINDTQNYQLVIEPYSHKFYLDNEYSNPLLAIQNKNGTIISRCYIEREYIEEIYD